MLEKKSGALSLEQGLSRRFKESLERTKADKADELRKALFLVRKHVEDGQDRRAELLVHASSAILTSTSSASVSSNSSLSCSTKLVSSVSPLRGHDFWNSNGTTPLMVGEDRGGESCWNEKNNYSRTTGLKYGFGMQSLSIKEVNPKETPLVIAGGYLDEPDSDSSLSGSEEETEEEDPMFDVVVDDNLSDIVDSEENGRGN